jgi:hypothetical protein
MILIMMTRWPKTGCTNPAIAPRLHVRRQGRGSVILDVSRQLCSKPKKKL